MIVSKQIKYFWVGLLIFSLAQLMVSGNILAEDTFAPVIVTADKLSETEEIKRGTGSAEIIDVSKEAGTMKTVTDVLEDQAGVRVKRYGGIGSESTISIRGSNANQVQIFLDGVPLRDSRMGEVNLESLSLDDVERIEVYRGFVPARFGGSAIGGAVNIITKKNKKKKKLSALVSLGYGSANTVKASGRISHSLDKIFYGASMRALYTDGDYRYRYNNGTVHDDSDDYWLDRGNNRVTSCNLSAWGGYKKGKLTYTLTDTYSLSDRGLAGTAGNETDKVNLVNHQNILNLNIVSDKLLKKRLKVGGDLYYAMKRDYFYDPLNELGFGTARQEGINDSFGLNFQGTYYFLKPIQEVSLSVNSSGDIYRASTEGEGDSPVQGRFSQDMALEDVFMFYDDRLRLSLQGRFLFWRDSYADLNPVTGDSLPRENRNEYAFAWQGGVRYDLIKKKLYIKSNCGEAVRIPLFSELYGDRGYIVGNSALSAERAFKADAGFGYMIKSKKSWVKNLRFEATYFYSFIKDIIVFIPNSQYTMKADNLSGAEVMGTEVTFSLMLKKYAEVSAAYTWQRALNKGDIPYLEGKILPNRPIHEASGMIKFFNEWGSFAYDINFIGYNYRDQINSEFYFVNNRLIHNITVKTRSYKGVHLVFEMKNISNSQISDIYGMPLPGRSLYGTLVYKLK